MTDNPFPPPPDQPQPPLGDSGFAAPTPGQPGWTPAGVPFPAPQPPVPSAAAPGPTWGGGPGMPGQPGGQPGVQYSPDGRFFWNGMQWVPVMGQGGSGGTNGLLIALGVGGGCLLLFIVVIVLLSLVGRQVNNVFSNVSNGLYYSPDYNNIFSNISNGLGQ